MKFFLFKIWKLVHFRLTEDHGNVVITKILQKMSLIISRNSRIKKNEDSMLML